MKLSNLPYLFSRLVVIILYLTMCASAVVSIGGIWFASKFGGGFAGVFGVIVCTTLPFSLFTGFIASRLFGMKMANSFTDFLLYPRHFLKKTPPLLSPVRGMIAAGEYEKALEELLKLRHESPEYPEISLMLFDLYEIRFGNPEAALQIAMEYFTTPSRKSGPDNLTLLFRTVPLLPSADARKLLQKEFLRKLYPRSDQNAIRERLATLEEKI